MKIVLKKIKKHPFVLLEILIALALTSLAALPLALSPIHALQKEREMLEEIEAGRIADYSFSEIKEMLLQNSIPWEELSTSKKNYFLDDLSFYLPGFQERVVQRKFTVQVRREKEGENNAVYRQLHITLFLTGASKSTFEFELFAQKI